MRSGTPEIFRARDREPGEREFANLPARCGKRAVAGYMVRPFESLAVLAGFALALLRSSRAATQK